MDADRDDRCYEIGCQMPNMVMTLMCIV